MTPPQPSRYRVLVVEDEDVPRLALVYLLESEDFEVAQARTGHDGLHLLHGVAFDSVVADHQLPGDFLGLDLLRAADRLQPSAGRVLLTGDISVSREDMPASCTLLYKPVEPSKLVAMLHKICALARRRRLGSQTTHPAIRMPGTTK